MAITLKEAFAKNGTPDLTSFTALQNACKNPGYFNDSRPINKLSSWEGYYYEERETIYQTNILLSNSSPSCASGSVTATIYTYRKDKDTSGTWTDWYLYSGATPSLSDNTSWLSVGSVANTGTGTYSASVSYSCNCKTTSTRNCVISVSANGASSSASLTQGADSYSDSGGTVSYGNWSGGTVSFNSTSNLSCGADSRTVTIQPWSRTATKSAVIRKWICGGNETITNSSSWTDYYTGTVTVSENHDYCSVNTTSYTASSSAKTLTLSKSSYGCTYMSAQTVTVSVSGATNTSNSLGIQANTYSDSGGASSTSYGSWSGGAISFNSTSDMSCGADSRTVTIQPWSRTRTVSVTAVVRTYCTGCKSTVADAYSNNYTDYYTGSVTLSENNGYTSLNVTSYTASSSAKTVTLSKSSCGVNDVARTYITVTATGPTTTSNGLYHAANGVTKTESNSQTDTGSETGYQIASFSVSPTSGEYNQGTFTASCKVQSRVRYRYRYRYQYRYQYCSGSWTDWGAWGSWGDWGAYGSWSGWSNVASVKPTITSNQSWCSVGTVGNTNSSGVSTTTCTYYENTGNTRTTTLTASYGGASSTATFTQSTAPNVIVNITNGICSWLSVNIDVLDNNWNTVNLATGDHNSSTYDGTVPVGTFNNWTSMKQNTTYWSANIYFRDYDTLGNESSSFTAIFHLYNANGQEVDVSTPISGECNKYIDTTIDWIVGRDFNSDIAKMEVEISFS